jgi:hypothetical protein
MTVSRKKRVAPATVRDKLEGSGYDTEEEFCAAKIAFREAARAQRCCQNPDCPNPRGKWDPHHVIYEQELRRRGLPIYEPRNALRLCRRCHQNHHRTQPIPLTALKTCNLQYAREVLGNFYTDYLNRRYLHECPI